MTPPLGSATAVTKIGIGLCSNRSGVTLCTDTLLSIGNDMEVKLNEEKELEPRLADCRWNSVGACICRLSAPIGDLLAMMEQPVNARMG